MDMIAQIIAWLNGGMNALFGLLRGAMAALPPWVSLTVLSALLGVVLLVLFKYTSNQRAIGRVRDRIKAGLLAMKLFKDNIPVVLKSQGLVFIAALQLLLYSIPPLLVMMLPFGLILGQLGTWYQAGPLETGREALVVMQLNSDANAPLPEVSLLPGEAYEPVSGPVRIPSRQEVCWKLRADRPGSHVLTFRVGDSEVRKTFTAGSGFMPVSMKRPSLRIGDLILYPAERPFGPGSPVRSIEIGYPDRDGPLTGSGRWVISLFVISMLSALAVKPLFKVKI